MNDVKTVIVCVLMTLISYFVAYYGFSFIPIVHLFIWLMLLFILGIRKATFYYLLVILIDGDISKLGEDDIGTFYTVFTTYFLGKSLSLIWTILTFSLLLLDYKNRNEFRVNKYLYPFILLFCVSFALSLSNDQFNITYFISDLGYFINLFTGFIAIYIYVKNKYDVKLIITAFITVVTTKALIVITDSILMSMLGFFNTYSVDSTSYLMPLAICLAFVGFNLNKSFNTKIIIIVSFFMIFTASRGRIFISFIAVILSGFFGNKKNGLLLLIASLPLLFIVVSIWNPDTANYLLWKLNTFLPSSGDATGKVESMSSMVRYVEFLNIIALHFDKIYTLFIGTGFGGYFTDNYVAFPFNLYGTSSYPDEWISNGVYYKPHGSLLFTLLKFGLLGYLCIFGTVTLLCFRVLINARVYMEDDYIKYVSIAVASYLPMLFVVNFTSKLQIYSGVLLALLVVVFRIMREKRE